jgi:hypothetical protein
MQDKIRRTVQCRVRGVAGNTTKPVRDFMLCVIGHRDLPEPHRRRRRPRRGDWEDWEIEWCASIDDTF